VPPETVHQAFEVEDFDVATQALQEKSISRARSGGHHDGQRFLFILDPAGNCVESCTPSEF
jgi:hypothetical protein